MSRKTPWARRIREQRSNIDLKLKVLIGKLPQGAEPCTLFHCPARPEVRALGAGRTGSPNPRWDSTISEETLEPLDRGGLREVNLANGDGGNEVVFAADGRAGDPP